MPDCHRETSLHRVPFWTLGASTRDNAQHIVALAEDKSLVLDPEICQKARADLTAPRARLAAEVAWFPGVSPKRAWQIATALREGFADPTLDAALPALAHANVLSAVLEILPSQTPATEITERIVCLAQLMEEIDAATVLRQINEDRSIAKFPIFRTYLSKNTNNKVTN